MQEQEQNNIDYLLLGKYLAGEATPQEAIAMDEWLLIPANKKHYEEIEKIWNGLPGDTQHQLPDRMAAWKELHISSPSRVVKFTRWYAAAASILVILAAVLFYFKNTSKPEEVINLVTIGPASSTIRQTLPDGSAIVLKKNSQLTYSNNFNEKDRLLQLQGESFFNVAHNKDKPFVITVGGIKVQVIGTSFNVKQFTKPDIVEVQVQTGIVKMFNNNKELTITKGKTGLYYKDQDLFTLKDSLNTNTISYATRDFTFYNSTMAELIPRLEEAYGVTIQVKETKVLKCTLTGHFTEPVFEDIMDAIALTVRIKYTKEGNIYYLEGEGCD